MIKLTWMDVEHRVRDFNFSKEITKVYGVPTGGIPVAIMVSTIFAIDMIEDLDRYDPSKVLIVDDIIDSGKTRSLYPDYEFVSVWDQRKVLEEEREWVEFPWERMTNEAPAENVVIRQLEYIGEDPNREGLVETPKRVIKAWDYLFSGYRQNPEDVIKDFDPPDEQYDEIVLLKNIELYSMCEHHLLPFYGKAHIAYIPTKKVIGVSKLARILEIYARRAQIQERIGHQVTSCLMKHLKPMGAACIIEAQHLCMQMRGVQKQNSVMITSSVKGAFFDDAKARQELMRLIK